MRSAAKLVGICLLAALLVTPAGAFASSQPWTVDDSSGAAPNSMADGSCDAPGPLTCTLPEAVLEANAANHTDTIRFSLPPASTIALQNSVALYLMQPMTIDGCNGAAATAPCVGIDGLAVNSTPIGVYANGVTIRGLAIGNGNSEGIFATCCVQGLTVRNNWFGMTITGAAAAGGAGIDLRGTGAMIGGTAPGDRNVFANNAGELRITGGTNNQVLGNYFGVAPDGVTPAPTINAASITIDNPFAVNATGNVIGGVTLASENLIANTTHAGSPAIRINGQGDDHNLVLRNRGTGNSGPFIDVAPPDGLGNNMLSGANNGIQPPNIQTSPGLLFGSARPNAAVLVYQGDGNAGDLLGFIGQATADGAGAWSLPCPSAGCGSEPAGGSLVVANQTDTPGNSSELTGPVAYVHSLPPPVPAPTPTGPTGQRAAALKKCKKKHSAAARRKCKRRAKALPV